MKIRIKGNSLRLRLSRSEVKTLASEGLLQEQTDFGDRVFGYTLQEKDGIDNLEAGYNGSDVTMYVPKGWAKEWAENDRVGFDHFMPLANGNQLYLLLEKDFKCIDPPPGEDQTDNYEHPKSNC